MSDCAEVMTFDEDDLLPFFLCIHGTSPEFGSRSRDQDAHAAQKADRNGFRETPLLEYNNNIVSSR